MDILHTQMLLVVYSPCNSSLEDISRKTPYLIWPFNKTKLNEIHSNIDTLLHFACYCLITTKQHFCKIYQEKKKQEPWLESVLPLSITIAPVISFLSVFGSAESDEMQQNKAQIGSNSGSGSKSRLVRACNSILMRVRCWTQQKIKTYVSLFSRSLKKY